MEVSAQLHHLGRFMPGERAPGTRWIRGCLGPKTYLDAVEKRKISCHCQESNPDSSTTEPVARRTDSATPVHIISCIRLLICNRSSEPFDLA
jgi:hypothetical protein